MLASSALGRRARARDSADVVVIGAGLAGLNAAMILEAEGMTVIVLEAADYIGGRTKTLDLPIGPTNAGAETVGPYYGRVRDLVGRLGVAFIPVPPRVAMGNYVNGALVSSADWSKAKANRTVGAERDVQPEALEFYYLSKSNPLPDPESWTDAKYAGYDIPLETYLRNAGASDEAIRLVNVSINTVDLATGSALAYLRDIRRLQWDMANTNDKTRSTYGASAADGFESNLIKGGTQRLAEAMAGGLKGEVRLHQTVRSIEMTSSGVDVRTIDGSRFTAKYVVSAVPFSALRNVEVFPNFPGPQLAAIHGSTHGHTLRVFLEFTAPFWEADIGEPGLFTDTAIERVFARRNEAGEIYALDCWVNGSAATRLDQLPSDAVTDFVVKTVNRIRPSTQGKLKAVKMHSWAKHSASACCRHVFNAGQVGKWAGLMATPHLRLHLAGEQTRSIENGMEAAAESGERAAYEILAREG
ncbi:MAG: FAD-dependent oxidoreductase [Rhodospirillaceae bacterium]|nr:FAD-dependent oxidoreductase [Rhodospirillaceae bacterium]